MEVFFGFLHSWAANNGDIGEHTNVSSITRCHLPECRCIGRDILHVRRKVGEHHVGVASGVFASAFGVPSAHYHRSPFTIRLGIYISLAQTIKLPVVIEWFWITPRPRDDVDPFLALVVTVIMKGEVDAQHIKLICIPPTYDVNSKTSLTHQVRGHNLFSSNHRIKQRDVHRPKSHDVPGTGQYTGSPGQRLKI